MPHSIWTPVSYMIVLYLVHSASTTYTWHEVCSSLHTVTWLLKVNFSYNHSNSLQSTKVWTEWPMVMGLAILQNHANLCEIQVFREFLSKAEIQPQNDALVCSLIHSCVSDSLCRWERFQQPIKAPVLNEGIGREDSRIEHNPNLELLRLSALTSTLFLFSLSKKPFPMYLSQLLSFCSFLHLLVLLWSSRVVGPAHLNKV